MSDPELARLVADLFPELLGAVGNHEQTNNSSSLSHLESIAYDVLNQRFVRPVNPIQIPQVTPTNDRRRPDTVGSGRRPVDVEEPRRQVTYPEFDELMHLYHRNVFEYNRTTQNIINEFSSNQSRTAREIREISNISHAFNQNMQEYHNITDNCLDLLRDMYFSQTYVNASRSPELVVEGRRPSDQNSHNRYTNRDSRTNTNTNINPVFNSIPQTNTTTTISPPRTLFSYTLFPYVGTGTPATGRQRPDEPVLLTPQQMRDSTEEYTYSSGLPSVVQSNMREPPYSLDTTSTVIPVCPISLEDFQEGDSITRIRECLHEFKTPHLTRWFLRSARCPVCRWNLLSPPTTRSNRSRSNSQLSAPSTVPIQSIDASNSSIVTLPSRLQDILADPSLNQISQRLFSNIFQNMLMNSTDAPPNIQGRSDTSMNFQSLFGNGAESLINSIDITYTIDYDSSYSGV